MKKVTFDKATLKILDLLQENNEISNAELAEAIGLSASPCWRRVTELREKNVITKSVSLVDPESLGLEVNVFVHITLKQQDKESLNIFTKAISSRAEIMECYLMTGDADYMLRIVVEDLKCYHEFLNACLAKIPVISNIKSSFALKQVKYTTALPTDHLRSRK